MTSTSLSPETLERLRAAAQGTQAVGNERLRPVHRDTFHAVCTPEVILGLITEVEELRGIKASVLAYMEGTLNSLRERAARVAEQVAEAERFAASVCRPVDRSYTIM